MNRLFPLLFGMVTFVAHAQVPDYVPTEGLVGWYSFDSDATDQSDNSFNGAVFGATNVEEGYVDGSLSFDGLDDYVEIPTNEVFESIVHELTLSAWFKKTNETNGTIVGKRNFVGNPCGERHHFELTCMDDQSIIFSAAHNCVEMHTTQVASAPESFNLGDWNHVVVTYLNGALKMFINGSVVVEHDEGYRELLPNAHWINFGRIHRSGGVPFFNEFGGEIDESGIWNRALTEEEILALYNAEPPVTGCTDSTACNFDAEATSDDGSCIPSGCMEPEACNYNALAECAGEACDFACCPGPGCCGNGMYWDYEASQCAIIETCQDDLDGDGVIGVNDLMQLLSSFGTDCAPAEEPETAEWTCGDPVNYHGYDYATVQIGEQCWFAENLRTELYQNGDLIPGDLSNEEWSGMSEGAQAVYANEASNLMDYGRLYNWYAVDDARGLCPNGWHVPTSNEFDPLALTLGGYPTAGEALKSSAEDTPSWNGTNTSGFKGLPAGYRDMFGSFGMLGVDGHWWTSTPYSCGGRDKKLHTDYQFLNTHHGCLNHGNSIRCLQD